MTIDGTSQFVMVGILYGDCPFTACQNETFGACGFGEATFGVWASPDLSQSSWTYLGEILPPQDRPVGIYFRPHMVYNSLTGKFVLWVRWLNVTGPTLAQDSTYYLTATADSVSGPFTVAQAVVPMYYNNSADDNLFVDDDGTGYIAHTCRACATHIVVERLSPDMTWSLGYNDSTARSEPVGPGLTEAPAMFKANGRYYLTMGRLCCYCEEGSPASAYTAPSPLGPYTLAGPGLPFSNATGAQGNFVFTHPDVDGVLWAGNRWGSDPDPPPPSHAPLFDRSLQYWARLSFADDGSIRPIVWADNFTLGVAPAAQS